MNNIWWIIWNRRQALIIATFRGRTKKVKKHRDEGEAYRGGRNPFQVSQRMRCFIIKLSIGWNGIMIISSLLQAAQNMSNRGEKFSRGKDERRSWGDERRGDDRKYSKGGDRSWSRGGEGERSSWGGGGGGGGGHRNGGYHHSRDIYHHNKGNHHRYEVYTLTIIACGCEISLDT